MKLYVVKPMVYGRGMCQCRQMKGGYSPLLLVGNEPNALRGGAVKPDMTRVKSMLSGLSPNPKKRFISI